MYISSPISYPLGHLLDYLLGKHTKSRFHNCDLIALIELHTHNALKKLNAVEDQDYHNDKMKKNFAEDIGLNDDQANLMISAIEMNKKKAKEKMIPLEKVFMFDYNKNIHLISEIMEGGYSRVPIYENNRNNIVGI
jgi:metal transporter CNNM